MKKLLFTLALVGASLASAKTYTVRLYDPAAIGNHQLKTGEYRLEINGDHVLLKGAKTVAEFTVQIENEARKFDNTTVTVSKEGGSAQIQEIGIGGTKTKLLFNR
jgi:hypothetical protein